MRIWIYKCSAEVSRALDRTARHFGAVGFRGEGAPARQLAEQQGAELVFYCEAMPTAKAGWDHARLTATIGPDDPGLFFFMPDFPGSGPGTNSGRLIFGVGQA